MSPAVELAKAIADTEFVPRALRHNAAAISAAILYGDEVGLGPMQALAKIAVIEGRPYMAAEAQRALVFAAGHDLWLDELTATRATWCGRRAGTDKVTRVTWTMDDARRAKIDGKDNWRKYPRAMLSARASADLVRAMFADVVGGLGALEELGDEAEELGVAGADRGADTTAPKRRRRSRGAATVTAPETPARVTPAPEDLPPLPGESTAEGVSEEQTAPAPALMSDAQRRHAMGLFGKLGYGGNTSEARERRMVLTREVVGNPALTSSKELTAAEADRLIDWLEAERAREPGDDAGDDAQGVLDVEGEEAPA